ncbi:hypothetical protein KOW79_005140 [Hemibagrus wyckioides]|uniref:Ig-like domain-containing protein n=1 Tax=Hemibagrus wyckioides TaxID=337641 RepID=A0A9D3NZ34_9TELE|nr:hypothetical protein KOW79_005140 [Hemibagrus wyckioides]
MRGILMCFILFDVGCAYCQSVYVETGKNHTFNPAIPGVIELGDWRCNDKLVKKQDSGIFKAQLQIQGNLKYFEHTLKVMDPVPQPKVTCKQIGTNVTLLCSVDPPVQAEFKWSGPNGFSHVGNSVHITGKQNEDSIYFCTAKNEGSSEIGLTGYASGIQQV